MFDNKISPGDFVIHHYMDSFTVYRFLRLSGGKHQYAYVQEMVKWLFHTLYFRETKVRSNRLIKLTDQSIIDEWIENEKYSEDTTLPVPKEKYFGHTVRYESYVK